jgi:hypothetical protein
MKVNILNYIADISLNCIRVFTDVCAFGSWYVNTKLHLHSRLRDRFGSLDLI